MDYQEFEQNVADYVEGALDDQLRERMDAARAADPACDQLARLHEQILAALDETPEVEAPAGLAEKIIAAAQVRNRLVEAERKAFKRGIWLGIIGALAGAVTLGVFMYLLDLRTDAATLETAVAAGDSWLTSASATLYGWMEAVGKVMNYDVALPVIELSVPLYLLLLWGMASAVAVYFREEIMEAVDIF